MEPTSYTSITLYNIGAITMERSAIEKVSEAEEKEAESFLKQGSRTLDASTSKHDSPSTSSSIQQTDLPLS